MIEEDAVPPSTELPTQIQLSDLPRDVQRKLAKAFERDQLKAKPLATSHNGRVLTASDGAQYVRMRGGLRRVVIAEDGVHTIKKWDQRKRRQMRRQRRIHEGASEMHAPPHAE